MKPSPLTILFTGDNESGEVPFVLTYKIILT